ncbi:MAG: hypothetical protein JHC31_01285 [Sulfurihydrogenibium sp.]|nr:hypothetical protein [Sulfurihydrogenibium sp.]
MIKLTSLNDLIISLISKSIGNSTFVFVVYPEGKGNTLLEFSFSEYRFSVSKKENELKIYDKGNIYLIQNIFPENYAEVINNIIQDQAERLKDYYKLYQWEDQLSKEIKSIVYKFTKHDLI